MSAPAELSSAELSTRLVGFVARELGVPAERVRAASLRRLAGGASRELFAVDLETPEGALELVLRRDPPGRIGESDRGLEMRVLQAAAEAGVPVPRVHWGSSDPAVLGAPFFLMDRVEGETLARRLLRDPGFAQARRAMTRQLGAALARVHAVDVRRPELAALPGPPPGASPARAVVEQTAERARALALEPHPVLELMERWLLERVPASGPAALVHGDYRIGNVIFGPEGLRAILDWELAHVGDPLEDLGWLCVRTWRFGSDALPVGGIGTREELVAAYEEAGGRRVDREALRFWEACGNFRVAVVWLQQSRIFLDGKVPSVELASLGRRTAETEEELLRLLREEA